MITAKWTGEYPNLCSGEWIIKINNKQIKDTQPLDYDSILRKPMQTFGTYSSWYFTEDWDAVFEDYDEGFHYSQWLNCDEAKALFKLIEQNDILLDSIDKIELFDVLQKSDWRHGSCGGCI